MRLDKEDNMTIDGAILTVDSHGDKFQCNNYDDEDPQLLVNEIELFF